jgi:hypothetical protein
MRRPLGEERLGQGNGHDDCFVHARDSDRRHDRQLAASSEGCEANRSWAGNCIVMQCKLPP